jgi:hypothetical protein
VSDATLCWTRRADEDLFNRTLILLRTLLARTAELGTAYREELPNRAVRATISTEELRRTFGVSLPGEGIPADRVIEILADAAERGTVASAGPRYFGFVTGGSTPVALAADPTGCAARVGLAIGR